MAGALTGRVLPWVVGVLYHPGMHLSLSDLVTCPRCGPSHGLALLPTSVRARRVESGVLGCANCRERYRIEGGVTDLRLSGPDPAGAGASAVPPAGTASPGGEAAVRLGALLGLAEARGPVLLTGPVRSRAAELAHLLDEVEVVVLVGSGEAPPAAEDGANEVTYVLARGAVPFRGGALTAAALTGAGTALVEEALRAVRPAGRVLVDPVTEELEARATAAGGAVVAREGSTLLVVRRA